MNYYEELGLAPDAADEDIRRAHRTLSKVLHPDRQTDPAARDAAELQMRRLNAMVDTLLDRQLRREYDISLRAEPPAVVFEGSSERRVVPRRRPVFGPLTSLLLTIFAGLVLTGAAAWFLGGDLLHFESSGNRPASPPENSPSPVPQQPVALGRGGTRPAAKTVPSNIPAARPSSRPDQPSLDPSIQEEIPDETPLQPVHAPSVGVPNAALPAAPATPVVVRPLDSSTVGSRPPGLDGLWLYAPETAKTGHSKLYAPEYIQLHIRVEDGVVRGDYSARYQVPDRPISAAVAFHFEGKSDDALSFAWQSDDGSRGVVDLKMLSQESLQVNWRAGHFGTRLGLGAGTAILIRKMNP